MTLLTKKPNYAWKELLRRISSHRLQSHLMQGQKHECNPIDKHKRNMSSRYCFLGLVALLLICILCSAFGVWPSLRFSGSKSGTSATTPRRTVDIVLDDQNDISSDVNADILNEYITPIKVLNASLNTGDLLYESMKPIDSDSANSTKDATSAFSMTGTFRNKSSLIWDPHPEYTFTVFGHLLHLRLHQDTSFIPHNTFRVIRILNNHTEESASDEPEHYLGCYYKGHIEGDPDSMVAVSLCEGMTGFIKTSFGSLLIMPVNQTNSDEILHRVWRHSQRNPRQAVSDSDMELEALKLAESLLAPLTRRKRHFENLTNQEYTLEVLIAVDHTMTQFHGSDLRSYILILFSIVSNIFADASIGNVIHISLVNMLELRDMNGHQGSGTAADRLKTFCKFLGSRGYHYDTAMLITRDQICGNEREERCSTLGLAELGTVCKPRSCSIVQDNGLPAAFTIAHELGHTLNMPHDDDDRCNKYNAREGNNRTLHIMASVMGDHMHPWSWSKCSQHYISEFLEKSDKSCLENRPSSSLLNDNDIEKLPGEIYSLDQQCQLIHGNDTIHCDSNPECQYLFCNVSSVCGSSSMPWADGTPCRNHHNWCKKGKCVPRVGGSLQLVHGGWGVWTAFTPCSLTCGGGVQESRRECDNPQPRNGGKYCVGSRKKYRSCNTHSCPAGTIEPREQYCYDMNGRNFNIRGISSSSKWIPKYGLDTSDKCKLFCRLQDDSAYFKLSEAVRDGTTCAVDSFDKCVNGICRPAGCDNELNSIAKLDKCGVCEGRNDTCEELTGNVRVADLLKEKRAPQSLYHVTTIPKGASNIVITQPGYPTQNYIVLADDRHVPLVNSVKVVTPFAKQYIYAGITIDYNGSNSTMERINTTYAWKLTRDLVVMIISIDLSAAKNQNTVLISYTYTVDKAIIAEPEVEIYRWQMQDWSSCDSLCQGTMYRQAACVSTTQGLKVAPQFCDQSAMPKPEYNACNTNCQLTLNVTSISECSAACGALGTREKALSCVQTFPDMQRLNIVDMSYCKLKFEIVTHEQCREGCWNYSEWSTCTKTCGTGTQMRELRCILNNTVVSDELCNPRTKLETRDMLRACNMEPCLYPIAPISTRSVNHWVAGDWGECSDWCKMTRTVSCAYPYGNHCPPDKQPKEVRNCCHIKYINEWGKCSVDCGSGIKRKVQRCARVFKPEVPGAQKRKEYISDSYCETLKVRKPALRKSIKHCKINCHWSSSEWSPCSSTCDDDYQSRLVRCESWQGNSVNERYCDATKRPSRSRICNNCMQRQYKILTPCDCTGIERRRILYYDTHRRRVAGRPRVQKQKCTPPPSCHRRSFSNNHVSSRRAQSCEDYQQMYRAYKDGEYTLQVRSRPVRVYCHKMNSLTPREYITVEPQENYSIYYEYKTRLINSCPPVSRDHEYTNDQYSGRSYFSKLRLNITDLRIIENDYEFAESRGQRQPLGSAGDCYNRNQQCPQGDFSINLERTGFTLRPGTRWNTVGSSAVMKQETGFETSRQSRRAYCGGFCGRCYIAPGSGLYVDVV
ncbi:CG14869 [Drosophila busckii]|uniref:CG14869 n=1 Tax=Drosophila busckii TaxID=30019 RepID=A0A0M3QXK2_DROBS|nr:CG14869 [Drosophila busckii]